MLNTDTDRGPGRPRAEHVPTLEATCAIHGTVIKRGYPNGERAGAPRLRWQCPACEANRKALSRPTTTTTTEKS